MSNFEESMRRLLGIKPGVEKRVQVVTVDAKELLKVEDSGFRGRGGCESHLFATCHFHNCDYGIAERTMRLAHQRVPQLVAECFKQAQAEALRKLTDDPPTAAPNS